MYAIFGRLNRGRQWHELPYPRNLLEPELVPGAPLPHMLDFFAIRFGATQRAGSGARA